MLESGKFAPIYSNLAQLKGYGKCVKGKIIIKAVWYHFINTTGLPPFGSPALDDITGSKDATSSHGSISSTTGWPSIPKGRYADFGSFSIEVELNCSPPYYEVFARGRGLDSTNWEFRKGRKKDEEGSDPYVDWYY